MAVQVEQLITEHLDLWTHAQTAKSTSGRGSNNKIELTGIKKLRELILELAVRGNLVPQDPNDEPASELLKRIAAEKEALVKAGKLKKQKPLPPITDEEKFFEIPEGWAWEFLKNLTSKLTDGSHNPPKDNGSGYPMLSGQNIGAGTIDYANPSRYVDEQGFLIENSRTSVQEGDVLLTIVGSIGRSAVVRDNAPKFVLQRSVAVLTPIQVVSDYLPILFSSISVQNFFESEGKGTAQKGIYLGQLAKLPIPVPPVREQTRIVAKVDELMALCDQLEQQSYQQLDAHNQLVDALLATLTQSQNADDLASNWQRLAAHFDTLFTTEYSIESLKQTILQLAVMGKLVKQDPNDEPASELLKRIAAEKDALVKAGKIKKQKPLPPISDEEKPFELPQGWEWVKLDLIAKNEKNALKAGPFGSALKKNMYVPQGYKIYGQEQVISGDESLGDYFVDEDKFRELESCKVEPGDMLISLVGTIGKVLILSPNAAPGIINPRLVKISLFNDISRNYIRVVLGSRLIQNELFEKSHGSTMNVLNLGLLRDLVFPLPPVEQQISIVKKVNQLIDLLSILSRQLILNRKNQAVFAEALVEQVVA